MTKNNPQPAHTANVTIRRARPGESEAIARFIRPFVEDGKLLDRTYEELEHWIDNLFIADREGEIVGCAALEVYSRKLAEIRSLAVAPSVQGTGVGKQLVNACVQPGIVNRNSGLVSETL